MDEQKLDEVVTSYKELMTPKECADYLGISLGSLQAKVTARAIPFESISPHCKRFRKASVDQWLKEAK